MKSIGVDKERCNESFIHSSLSTDSDCSRLCASDSCTRNDYRFQLSDDKQFYILQQIYISKCLQNGHTYIFAEYQLEVPRLRGHSCKL